MKKNKAFTLIELLVVVSIIALLVSILMPALRKARFQARCVVCLSNQRQIGLAMIIYASDNDDRLPYHNAWNPPIVQQLGRGGNDLRPLLEPYAVNPEVFYCPGFSHGASIGLNWGIMPYSPDDVGGWCGQPEPIFGTNLIHYNLWGGFHRTPGGANDRAAYIPMNQELYDPPSPAWQTELPRFGDKYSNVRRPAEVPLVTDYMFSFGGSLIALFNGSFVNNWDEFTGGPTTMATSHFDDGRFHGLGVNFWDGHSEWRKEGVAEPRIMYDVGGGEYIGWY